MPHLVPLALQLGLALGDALGRLCEALVCPAVQQAPCPCPPYRVQALNRWLHPGVYQHLHEAFRSTQRVQNRGGPPRLPHDSRIEGTQALRVSQLL